MMSAEKFDLQLCALNLGEFRIWIEIDDKGGKALLHEEAKVFPSDNFLALLDTAFSGRAPITILYCCLSKITAIYRQEISLFCFSITLYKLSSMRQV